MAQPISTLSELKAHIWRCLPPIRRNLAGQKAVNDLVDAAVLEFPDRDLIRSHPGSDAEKALASQLTSACKRHYCAMHGEDHSNIGAIWTIVLIQIAQVVVSMLLKWWWESAENRALMVAWRQAGRKEGGA